MATFCACFLLFQREPAKEKILKKQRIFCRRTKFLRFSGYLFRNSETKREAKKDIEDKTSVFSRLPRPVGQEIYGPYFSDILPCAIHSGRSRTHTIFTLSGISFEAGILLLQDLGLFYSAVETDSPNRKPENKRM